MTFFPMLPSISKNSEPESNPMPLPLYLYLSESELLVSFIDSNKQFFHVIPPFKFLNHGVIV